MGRFFRVVSLLLRIHPLIYILSRLTIKIRFSSSNNQASIFTLLSNLINQRRQFILCGLRTTQVMSRNVAYGTYLQIMNFKRTTISSGRFPIYLSQILTFSKTCKSVSISSITIPTNSTRLIRRRITSQFFFPRKVMNTFFLLLRQFIISRTTFRDHRPTLIRREKILTFPGVPSMVRHRILLQTIINVRVNNTRRLIRFVRRNFTLVFHSFSASHLRHTIQIRQSKNIRRRIKITSLMRTTIHRRATRILFRFLTAFRQILSTPRRFFFFSQGNVKILNVRDQPILIFRLMFLSFSASHPTIRISVIRRRTIIRPRFQATASSLTFRLRLCSHSHLIRTNSRLNYLFVRNHVQHIHAQSRRFTKIISVSFRNRYHRKRRISTVTIFGNYRVTMTRTRTSRINSTPHITNNNPRPRSIIITPLSIRIVMITGHIRSSINTQPTIMSITSSIRRISHRTLSRITRNSSRIVNPTNQSSHISSLIRVNKLIQLITQLIRRFLSSMKRLLQRNLTRFQTHMFKQGIPTSTCRLIRYSRVPIIRIFFTLPSRFRFLFQVMSRHTGLLLLRITRHITRCLIRFTLSHAKNVFRRVIRDLILTISIKRRVLHPFQRIRSNLRISSFHTNIYRHQGTTYRRHRMTRIIWCIFYYCVFDRALFFCYRSVRASPGWRSRHNRTSQRTTPSTSNSPAGDRPTRMASKGYRSRITRRDRVDRMFSVQSTSRDINRRSLRPITYLVRSR